MVKKVSKSKDMSVKEVTVEKPKEPEIVTPTQPSKPEIKEPVIDLEQLKNSIVSELKPVEVPKKPRKKREKKQHIEHGQKTQELQPIQPVQEKSRTAGFYVGIALGIIAGTLGLYYLYTKFKEKSNSDKMSEDEVYEKLSAEGLKKIENLKKYQ